MIKNILSTILATPLFSGCTVLSAEFQSIEVCVFEGVLLALL